MNKLIKVILFLIVGMVQAFAWGGLRGDTLAKELDEAVLNRSFYLQQREQRITQLKDMFLLSKISLWQEYEINHQLIENTSLVRKYPRTGACHRESSHYLRRQRTAGRTVPVA